VLAAVAAALPLALAAGCSGSTAPGPAQAAQASPGGATAGRNAFSGLDVVIILAAALMAAGCAWGLSRRLAEYR
jgi:hypothetical protein